MTQLARLHLVFALALPVALGCGSDGTGDGDDNPPIDSLVSLTISPPTATLTIEGETPAKADFTAMGTFEDGTTADITDEVVFRLDNNRMGNFSGGTLTTSTAQGGRTKVRAQLNGVEGAAELIVILNQRYNDPAADDLPEEPGSSFEGEPDEARAPSLVYPAPGVLVPPNLRELEFHFYPGEGNTLFELTFSSEITDVKVYTRCTEPLNGGCIYTPDSKVWKWIAETNRAGTATLTVRGTDDEGSGVGVSEPLSVQFSQDDIGGAIYYWTTSDTQDSSTAIMRFDFASTSQTEAERFIGTEQTGGKCVGCHALSRDGEKLLTASDSSFNAFVLLLDVARKMPLVEFGTPPRSAFSSWNPDGSQYVGVFADEQDDGWVSYDLNIFNGNTGALIETIDVGGTENNPTAHPDWSPDGKHIVYSHVGVVSSARRGNGTLAFAEQCSLRMVSNDGGSWTEPVELTQGAAGQSTYYPTFSPDGDILVFNKSECASGQNGADCDSYDDPGATLFAMLPEPGAEAVELAKANAPGVTDELDVVENSYPKWSPFTFRRTGEFGSRLHWVTFSSNRMYGLRAPGKPEHTLIWMAGVDPDAVRLGKDPSFPAFALPFQDLTTDNHTAQWAERVAVVE